MDHSVPTICYKVEGPKPPEGKWPFHVYDDENTAPQNRPVSNIPVTANTINFAMFVTDKKVFIDYFTQSDIGVGVDVRMLQSSKLVILQKQIVFMAGKFTKEELHQWHATHGLKTMDFEGKCCKIQSIDLIEELKSPDPQVISVPPKIFESAQLEEGVYMQNNKAHETWKLIMNSAWDRPDLSLHLFCRSEAY